MHMHRQASVRAQTDIEFLFYGTLWKKLCTSTMEEIMQGDIIRTSY